MKAKEKRSKRSDKNQQILAQKESEIQKRKAEAEKLARNNEAQAQKLAEREKLIAQREAKAAATIENQVPKTAKLTGVKRNGSGLDTAVLLKVQGNPSLQIERIENPPRLVIDMMETERNTSRTVYGVKSPYDRRVRLGDHDSKVRAVLDLRDEHSTHNVQKVPEGILVSMKRVEPKDKVAAGGPAQTQAIELSDVQFKRNGQIARIELGINPKEMPRVDTRSKKAWILNLEGATISKALEKSLDTTAYDTVVRLVSAYQANENPPVVKVVANITGPASTADVKTENSFGKSRATVEPCPVASSSAPQTAGFVSQAASPLVSES